MLQSITPLRSAPVQFGHRPTNPQVSSAVRDKLYSPFVYSEFGPLLICNGLNDFTLNDFSKDLREVQGVDDRRFPVIVMNRETNTVYFLQTYDVGKDGVMKIDYIAKDKQAVQRQITDKDYAELERLVNQHVTQTSK